ncbi:MAG: hypothetical protein U0904_11535 [Candidatus Nanopelagicales bacterium]|nr:hypothetical protein [Candidatus Nanopelagicales bacterium]
MSEHLPVMGGHFWGAYGPDLAVRWLTESTPMGPSLNLTTFHPDGLVFYGAVESSFLAGRFSQLRPPVPDAPGARVVIPPEEGTDPSSAPTQERVRAAWENGLEADRPPSAEPDCERRREGETVEAFLSRIADAYMHYLDATGRPTRDIAAAAGVTRTSVGRWVRDARLAGLLPVASRGRTGGVKR